MIVTIFFASGKKVASKSGFEGRYQDNPPIKSENSDEGYKLGLHVGYFKAKKIA